MTRIITEWRPSQEPNRIKVRPRTPWSDDIERIVTNWIDAVKEFYVIELLLGYLIKRLPKYVISKTMMSKIAHCCIKIDASDRFCINYT